MQELAREISSFKTLPVDEIRKDYQKKPQYSSDNLFGSCIIDNIKIYDRISHSELANILEMFANCKQLLYGNGITKDQEVQKKHLLSLLGSMNWGVKDYTLQARLLRTMEDRLNSQIFLSQMKDSQSG